MADIKRKQGEQIPVAMQTRYKDMGDGTHALVVAAGIDGALPAGNNHIGQVAVDASLPAGANSIGTVGLDAGDNHIGEVDVRNVSRDWVTAYAEDDAPNDSDKSFQVPAGQEWHILNIWAEFKTEAEQGNRRLAVNIHAPNWADVIAQVRVGVEQVAETERYYQFGPSMADLTAFRDADWLMTPIPPTWIIQPGWFLRVWDQNQIAPLADDLVVRVLYAYRSI